MSGVLPAGKSVFVVRDIRVARFFKGLGRVHARHAGFGSAVGYYLGVFGCAGYFR